MNRSRDTALDLLRIAAALVVVGFHYLDRGPRVGEFAHSAWQVLAPVASYGYLGVHLFFMISGYVILMSAERSNAAAFVASRVSRLLPAFWVAASLTALSAWLLQDARFMVTPADYAWNLTLVPEWFKAPMIDGVYWSLSVEIHFYLLVLLVLLCGQIRRIEGLVAFWLILSCIEMLILPSWTLQSWFCARWAPLFAGGILFYRLRAAGPSIWRWTLVVFAGLLAAWQAWLELVDAGGGVESGSPVQPAIAALIVIAYFAVFAWLHLRDRQWVPRRWISLGAALSYPLYLVHQNVGYMLISRLQQHGLAASLSIALAFGVVLLISWLIFSGVERTLARPLRLALSRILGGSTTSKAAAPAIRS